MHVAVAQFLVSLGLVFKQAQLRLGYKFFGGHHGRGAQSAGDLYVRPVKILERIESGKLDVDDLTDKVKKVASLLDVCKTKLKTTEVEIQKVIESLEEPD